MRRPSYLDYQRDRRLERLTIVFVAGMFTGAVTAWVSLWIFCSH